MATTGVTWSTTAKGNRLISTVRERAKHIPISTPPTMASPSAQAVSFTVNQSDPVREEKSRTRVEAIRLGAGMR